MLLATEGEHPIFQGERMTDIRAVPLRYNGVTIRCVNGKARVAWSEGVYRKLRRGFLKVALGQAGRIEARMAAIRHPMYPDIIRQKERILRAVSARRKRAGKPRLSLGGHSEQ